MLIQNVDTVDGMTNGATCTIMSLDPPTQPRIIWVLFDDPDIGRNCRSENKKLYRALTLQKTWTPILRIERRFQVGKQKNLYVVRRQFPLKHCSATTIHKSQGSSLQQAVTSCKGYVTSHMIYVALSRLTSLNGLHLLDIDEKKIKVDINVKNEMKRLRTSKMLVIRPIHH